MADERRNDQDQAGPGGETQPSGPQPGRHIAIDGNEAAASVAYRLSEVIAIYPITPSSTMAELSDEWAAKRQPNIWGSVPDVVEMQSESGAAAAVHGALQAGARATTFTASQGLLLMIPDMYKIAGELLPYVKHVSARAIATHALSIFGDHSDVMACRQTGFAMLASANVQEAHDLAVVAHAATLESRVPFLHFMDGFRTSHEVNTMQELSDADLAALVDPEKVREQRGRRLDPDRPVLRGATANPDTFFQGREVVNPFYTDCPAAVQTAMDRLAERTGRRYGLFEYEGHPQAERVVVAMASGAEVAHATVERLAGQGERVGVVKVRLYRPFSVPDFLASLPASVQAIGVLDRTKEPGSIGEPLYLDVVAALQEARAEGLTVGAAGDGDSAGDGRGADPAAIRVIGGRYGLGSKEFDPAMVKAVLDELTKDHPKNHFTVGIDDDLSHTSLAYDEGFVVEPPDTVRGIFVALGADGTVGANKNSIKIIGEETGKEAHGYFVYDSKKSGGITVSHLRFGPHRLRTSYLIRQASFVACHHYRLLDRTDVLDFAAPGAVFLLNTPYGPDEVWAHLRPKVQRQIREKDIDLWVIDAFGVAAELGLGVRINTIMQTCFFAISGVLPRDDAIARIKASIEKTYGRKGPEVVRQNFEAVDGTLARLHQVPRPTAEVESVVGEPGPLVPDDAPEFIREVTAMLMAGEGDRLPVSLHPVDGTWPLETSRYEKRNVALEIPIWDPRVCIQCGKCAFVCPHSTIRTKVYGAALLDGAPADFKSVEARGKQFEGMAYTVQVAPEDCTGCRLCVTTCPGKDRSNPSHKAITMQPHDEHVDQERERWDFFRSLPAMDRAELDEREVRLDVKTSQLLQPLFEFHGACAGCGETQYQRLVTQLFGDRALIACATGCASIYGGNLPTQPYAVDHNGRGPAWINSLFENNAEFGLGMRLAVDKQAAMARELLARLAGELGDGLVDGLLQADQADARGLTAQRERVAALKERLADVDRPEAQQLAAVADLLVDRSVWIVGGDGWAYDIDYGGLDHVLYLGRNVNVLVHDTMVYSNTGGQMSKSTPMASIAKFASAGKAAERKDLGLMAMTYGNVYVAQVAWGARDAHTVRALLEAESYPGTSLIIGYAHCIGHGYDLSFGAAQQKAAVESGMWPLYRFDPRRREQGLNPLQLDSAPPDLPLPGFMARETRFGMLERLDPERARVLRERSQHAVRRHFRLLQQLSELDKTQEAGAVGPAEAADAAQPSESAATRAAGAPSAAGNRPEDVRRAEETVAQEARGEVTAREGASDATGGSPSNAAEESPRTTPPAHGADQE